MSAHCGRPGRGAHTRGGGGDGDDRWTKLADRIERVGPVPASDVEINQITDDPAPNDGGDGRTAGIG